MPPLQPTSGSRRPAERAPSSSPGRPRGQLGAGGHERRRQPGVDAADGRGRHPAVAAVDRRDAHAGRVALLVAGTLLIVLPVRGRGRATRLRVAGREQARPLRLTARWSVGSAVLVGARPRVAVPHAVKDGVSALTRGQRRRRSCSRCCCSWARHRPAGTARHGWRRLVGRSASVVAALLVVDVLALPVAACTVPATTLGGAPPSSAGSDVRRRHDDHRDGVRLAGWYLPSTTGAAVVLLHGPARRARRCSTRRSCWRGRFRRPGARRARARPQSRSRHGLRLARRRRRRGGSDVAQPHGRTSTRSGIALVGLSMGGEEAIGAAGADPRVRACRRRGGDRPPGRRPALAVGPSTAGEARRRRASRPRSTAVARLLATDAATDATARRGAAGRPRPVLLITAGNATDEQHAAADLRRAAPRVGAGLERCQVAAHTSGCAPRPSSGSSGSSAFLAAATADGARDLLPHPDRPARSRVQT